MHATAGPALPDEIVARQAMMATLAAADPTTLLRLWEALSSRPLYHCLRGPETGLVMVRGRIGGGGAPFNLGEATVTRATVKLDSGELGHAHALGRDHRKAEISAALDALWQRDAKAVERDILTPMRAAQAEADALLRAETAATKVDFFTMVRGDD